MLVPPVASWANAGLALTGATVGGVVAASSQLVTLENLGAAALMYLTLKLSFDFAREVLGKRRRSSDGGAASSSDVRRHLAEMRERDERSRRREEKLLEAQHRTARAIEESLASDRHQEQVLIEIRNGIQRLREGIGCPLSHPDGRRSVAQDFADHGARRAEG